MQIMNFGDRVKEERESRGWTQDHLAQRAGIKQQNIHAIESRSSKRSEFAPMIAEALGVELEWLMTGRGPKHSGQIAERMSRYSVGRLIPVLNTVQAGSPKEMIDDYAPGAGWKEIQLDATLSEHCSPHTFAVEIDGLSMYNQNKAESMSPGDIAVVDPMQSFGSGDIVVAKIDRDGSATIKKFRDRGIDDAGRPIFELVALNEDFSPILVNAANPGRVVGPVIEVRRKLPAGRAIAQPPSTAPQKRDPEIKQWAIIRVADVLARRKITLSPEQFARVCRKVSDLEQQTGEAPSDTAIVSIAEKMS